MHMTDLMVQIPKWPVSWTTAKSFSIATSHGLLQWGMNGNLITGGVISTLEQSSVIGMSFISHCDELCDVTMVIPPAGVPTD